MAMNPYSNPPAVATGGGEGGGATTAAELTADTSSFNGVLSSADGNVQAALETLDNHSHDAPAASGVPTTTDNFSGVLSGADTSVQAALETIDQHTHANPEYVAQDIGFTPAGNIEATNVQIAIEELDSEKINQAQLSLAIAGVGAGGGIDWSNIVTASGTVLSAGNGYHLKPSADMQVLLPPSPSGGNVVGVCDSYAMATTYNLVIGRNGELIAGEEDDLSIDTNGSGFKLCFIGDTRGWVIIDNI